MSCSSRTVVTGLVLSVLTGNCFAQVTESATPIDVPDDAPLIEARQMTLTALEAPGLPPLLQGVPFYVSEVGDVVDAGRLEFSVKRDGVVLLLASWEYDGNSSGGWKEEALGRGKLGESWLDLGAAPWDEKLVVFARECRNGETFKIRTRKYNPPQPVLIAKSRLAGVDEDSSTFAQELVARLQEKPLIAKGDSWIDAAEMVLMRLDVVEPPPLLESAMIYANEKQADVQAGRAEFTVTKDSVVLLLASWAYDGNSGGDWKPEAVTREQLGKSWIDLGVAEWDETQVLFARRCKAGETFKIRTRKYNPPQPILIPQSRLDAVKTGTSPLETALLAGLNRTKVTPPATSPPATTPTTPQGLQVPDDYPLIDAGELKLARLEAKQLPELLDGALIYVNEQNASIPAGRLEFTVEREGVVLLLANWQYGGNPSGGWKEEVVSREQLGRTWLDLGKAPWDEKLILFAKNCKKGETFKIRTRKYDPPQPILISKSRTSAHQNDPAQLAEMLMKKLGGPPMKPPAEAPAVASTVPEGFAVVEVDGMQSSPLEGENVPAYLDGAIIYQRDESQMNGDVALGELTLTVKRGGLVYLLATWQYDGNNSGGWTDSALSYARLSGQWAPLGRCPWDSYYWLFVRECKAGEEFSLRTRKYHAPLPIIGPPVDLLSEEYAKVVPVRLHDRRFQRRIRTLFTERKYDELERIATDARAPDSVSASGRSPLTLLYDQLCSVSPRDNQHFLDRISQLEEWVAAAPDSLTAKVALAELLTNYAYFARGSGYANTVTDRQLEVFQEQLERAEDVLLDVAADAPKDSFYYTTRITVVTGLGATKQEVLRWVQAAVELAPWDTSAVHAAANFLLPRWHGEPGDLVELAETLVELTQEECGEALYARTVLAVSGVAWITTFSEADFSWERTKQGLADLRKKFPRSTRLLNDECFLAALSFDRELAASRIEEIGDNPDLSRWGTIHEFEAYRQTFSDDNQRGAQDRLWLAHARGVKEVRFSPDGAYVATSGHDQLIKIWNVESGREIRRQLMRGHLNCIDYLDDDTLVIGDMQGGIRLWKWDEDEVQYYTQMAQAVHDVCCSADGRYLYAADYLGNTFVVDLQTGQGIHRGEREHGYYNLGVFSADSRYLATTGEDGRIVVHNLEIGRPETKFVDDETPKDAVAFSPDGKLVATGDENGIVRVWRIDGWQPVASTVEEGDRVRGLAFSPDGKRLAVARGGGMFFESGRLSLLDVNERAIERQIPGHTTCVNDVDFAPNGDSLVSVGHDWTLRTYDATKLFTKDD